MPEAGTASFRHGWEAPIRSRPASGGWRNQWPPGIAARLYSVSLVSLLLFGSLSFATAYRNTQTQAAARRLFNNGIVGTQAAGQLLLHTQLHRRLVDAAPDTAPDPAPASGTNSGIGSRQASLRAGLQRVRTELDAALASARLVEGDIPSAELARVADGVAELDLRGAAVLDLVPAGRAAVAREVNGPYGAAADRLGAAVLAWRGTQLRASRAELEHLQATGDRLHNAAWWGMAAVLVAGLAGTVVTRRGLQRLASLSGAMLALARGNVAVTVPFRDDDDEVGDLARATEVFRTMAMEVRRREAELLETTRRLDTALTNMGQGLCMFDVSDRLRVVNRRFCDIYGLPPLAVPLGCLYHDLVPLLLSTASAESTEAAMLATHERFLAEREPLNQLDHLLDGRSVAVTRVPLPEGGWVATFEDVTERKQAEAQIVFMARHDALTRLPNRTLLRERLEAAIAGTRRGGMAAVLCLNLDRFKAVNDSLGHKLGDMLLQAVSNRLQACVREVDTLARLGGDEFAIVQTELANVPDTSVVAQRIIDVLGQPFNLDSHQVMIGASIGIAIAPIDSTDPDTLLKQAYLALQRAKHEGRSTFRCFEPGMDAQLQRRRQLELDLRQAVCGDELEVFYQPLLHLAANRVCGFEALVRWRHPERGLVSPGEFIPLAEETGLIVEIGEWVLRNACHEAARWPSDVKVAVNLSALQFKGDLISTVREALTDSRLAANRLELEITETMLLKDGTATLKVLYGLRELGVGISMDDFGTGYSSLSYLNSFPFDKIKIDQSFVRSLVSDGEANLGALAIIRAVTGLGQSLGMLTTAEGVETAEQLAQLRAEGCTEVQGYLFSPPRPAAEVGGLLARLNGTAALAPVPVREPDSLPA